MPTRKACVREYDKRIYIMPLSGTNGMPPISNIAGYRRKCKKGLWMFQTPIFSENMAIEQSLLQNYYKKHKFPIYDYSTTSKTNGRKR